MGHATDRVKQYWPSLAATLLLGCTTTSIVIISLRQNAGHLVYALDDSYILMAMAKNLAHHGVWGVSPYSFSPNSSSPLWTFLLGILFRLTGVNTATPLILNLFAAVALILTVQWILESLSPSLPRVNIFIILLAILFFAPVPNLIFLGLEHILHMLLALLFAFYGAQILADRTPPARAGRLGFLALGMALGAVRYEGLFEAGVVVAALLVQRRARLSFELALCASLPALVMGIVSIEHGWFWLPTSVMLKGNIPVGKANPLEAFLAHAAANTVDTGMRVVRLAAVAVLLMLWRSSRQHEEPSQNQKLHGIQVWMLGIFVGAAVLHLLLARMGWFFRYEAYLIAWGLTAVAVPLWELVRSLHWPMRLRSKDTLGWVAAAVLAFSAPLFWRTGSDALNSTLPALHDTYRCHYQMGLFVARYYSGSSVVVNDIGAVNFLADIHCTDPHGLADREVARAILSGEHTSEFLDKLARSRGARVALVDDNWLGFYGGTPRSWLPAGLWIFPNRVVLAPPGLTFYALDEPSRKELIQNLRDYSHLLPADVVQRGPFQKTQE
jgi:hypothetical protein